MEAGRELDARIGLEVMELDVEPSSNYDGWYDDLIPIGDHMFIDPQGWVYNKGKDVVDGYSTNMFAAMKVVEKLCNFDVDDNVLTLRGQGPDIVEEHPDGTEWIAKQWWEAEIEGISGKFVGEAETPSHAICLAALKYVNREG